MEEYLKFRSSDGVTDIDAKIWTDEAAEPVAALQIAHGMNEYKERYHRFACYLAARGFIVCASDHAGHGNSVSSPAEYGCIGGKHPDRTLVNDMAALREIVASRYSGLPYFMLGHSMGSYLLREYLGDYGQGLAGAVIMGTGQMPGVISGAGVAITELLAAFRGWSYRSRLIPRIMYDKNYRIYDLTGRDTSCSWLTRDPEIVKAYYADPKCTFRFALSGYRALFSAVAASAGDKLVRRIPAELPMLVVSGSKDPVGAMGEGTKKAYEQLISTGHGNTSLKLFEDCRHEILNELNKEQVYAYIYEWLVGNLNSRG